MKSNRGLLLFAIPFVAAVAAFTLVPRPAAGGGTSTCGIEGAAADPPAFDNCARCHLQFLPNSGDGAFALTGVPAAWSPGQVYRLAGVLSDPGQSVWGFHVTAIDGLGSPAGTLAPADANTRPCLVNSRPYLSQSGSGRFAGMLDGPVTWSFDWTAPLAGRGTVRFYADGIATNGDGGELGDFTYTAAAASVEGVAPGSGVTVVLQPDAVSIPRGGTMVVRARVTNHGAAPRTAFLASRVRLASGRTYPRSGFLEPPLQIDLGAFEQQDRTLTLAIPSSAPTITAQYESLVGELPHRLLGRDAFSFSVR